MKEQFLKIETVAEMLEVSVWTVRKWILKRRIRVYKFGRAVRIRESDVLDFGKVIPSIDEMKEEFNLDN